jgi:methanogenic corrinoid protein MtbC1
MIADRYLDRLMLPLLAGRREECRAVLSEAINKGVNARMAYKTMIWPAMERIAQLYRDDQINLATEHMATRISRCLADQLQAQLSRSESNGKRILITCADGEPEELGAQMCADLFEAEGWEVYFIGGGVPNDEILELVGKLRPNILMIFGTQPAGVPGVRQLIDLIREVGANPSMNVMISGGVFNRAEGLWKEVNADLFAGNATEGLKVAAEAEPRKAEVKIPGAPKKRRRRRRPPLLVQAEAS